MDDTSPDALDAQQTLVESSLPLVFATHDDAAADGVARPLVVVVVDCEDPLGAEIARGWLGDEAINDAILARQSEDPDAETTVFARAASLAECREELARVFPYLAPALRDPPPEAGVLVVGVTAGGASLLTAPDGARPARG